MIDGMLVVSYDTGIDIFPARRDIYEYVVVGRSCLASLARAAFDARGENVVSHYLALFTVRPWVRNICHQ